MKRYFRRNCTSVVLFLVSNLLAAVSSVLMSFLLGLFADSAMEGDLSRVWKIALVTLVYLCVETFFAFLLDYSRDIVVQRVGRDLRADAVRKIESLSYMQKSEKDDGACLSLVQNDVDTIQQDYVASLGEIYFQICCFLLAVASAAAIQPVMTLIMIAVSVLTAAFPKLTEKRLQTYQENEQQAKAGYLTAITQIFSGFFQLKIFNAFSGANRAHDEANENLYRKKLRSRRIRRILYAGAYGCGNLVVLGTWVLGLFFVARGVITLPALITFAGLMNLVAGPVQIISERYSSTIAASAVCKRVLAFLDEPTDEASGWGSQPLTRVETVSLRDISCRRGEREILKHVDLTLQKGDRIALLGESGAGKSTLLKVLAAMCGAFLGGAASHRPMVIDGFISVVAALCAVRLCPTVRDYLVPSHASYEIGYKLAMEAMGLQPIFLLGMRLGEGSGCPLAFQVLDAACAVINDMATFDQAGIDDGYLDEIREGDKFTVEAPK